MSKLYKLNVTAVGPDQIFSVVKQITFLVWLQLFTHCGDKVTFCGSLLNVSTIFFICRKSSASALPKYRDVIANSHLVRSGSPAVYQLKTTTEFTGGLKRVTLGKKGGNHTRKTVLLVGETGAGKSALVNMLVNHAMGVSWEDDVWFEVAEEERRSCSESQTSAVTLYQISGFAGKTLPSALTIIDTPGFGNTEGTGRDVATRLSLLKLIQSDAGECEINAVGLVLKASDNRMNDRLRCVFDSVASLLDKKVVPLITHSDGGPPDNVLQALEERRLNCVRDHAGPPLYFLFNNRQSTRRAAKHQRALRFAWDLTVKQTQRFLDFLTYSDPRKNV